MNPKFSVILPARNEEAYIGDCLRSIKDISESVEGGVEIVVVINRCRDRTEDIARSYGARIVYDDRKNLAALRNEGAKQAQGDILLTIDADSVLHKNTFHEITKMIESGRYIGGAVLIRLERLSLGLILTMMALLPLLLWYRISGGSFWLYRKDFEHIGGFNEEYLSFEDIEFARRLRKYGQRRGKRFKILFKTPIITSCRKFDKWGDWYLLLHPLLFFRLMKGQDRNTADRLWYEDERREPKSQ